MGSGPLAQLAEQRTFNPRVVGSSPTGPTALSLVETPMLRGMGTSDVGDTFSLSNPFALRESFVRPRSLLLVAGAAAVLATTALGSSAATAAGSPTDTRTSITVDCAIGEGSNDNHMLLPNDVLTITLLNCEDWAISDNDGIESMTIDNGVGVSNYSTFVVPSSAPSFVVTVNTANMGSGVADLELYDADSGSDIDIDIVVASPAATPTGSLLSTTRVTMPVDIDTFSFAVDMIGGPSNDALLAGDADCEIEVGYHPYQALPVTITAAGDFTFRVIDVTPIDEDVQWGQPYFPSQDLFLAVYEDFDPTNP